MSVASLTNNTKGEKSKKFQSLNINNIYQGSVNKTTTRSAPQKHGLQSLGKIPTARRAPANLPSLKAENFGNDPNVCLVPGNGTGWAGGKEESGTGSKKEQTEKKVSENTNKPPAPNTGFDLAKSWQNVPDKPKSSFLSQRSPLFGQEFPSLGKDANLSKKPDPNSANPPTNTAHVPPSSKANDTQYGPGPNLRPQTSGNWMHGGSKAMPGNPPQEEEPQQFTFKPEKGPQFDVSSSAKHPHMPIPTNILPPKKAFMGNERRPMNRQQNKPPRDPIFQASIIDNEKLRRMDYFETNEDDWTRNDDNFDYNKKLASDEEDEPIAPWDHLNKRNERNVRMPPPVSRPPPTSAVYDTKRDVIDDEEQQRVRKKEEVMKNIERARKRREEEEKKYKTDNTQDRYRDQEDDSQSSSYHHYHHRNAPVLKKPSDPNRPSFGNFDVVVNGGGRNDSTSSGKSSQHDNSAHKQQGGPVPQPPNQRFKRHGGELKNFIAQIPYIDSDEDASASSSDASLKNEVTYNEAVRFLKAKFHALEQRGNLDLAGRSPRYFSELTGPDVFDLSRELREGEKAAERKKEKAAKAAAEAESGKSKSKPKPKPLMSEDVKPAKERMGETHERDRQSKRFQKQSIPIPKQQQPQQQQQQQPQHGNNKFVINKGATVEGNDRNVRGKPRKFDNQLSDEESWDKMEEHQPSEYRGLHQKPKYQYEEDAETIPKHGEGLDSRGNGWFMPRGQPSRRGRGSSSSRGGRAPPRYEGDVKFFDENGSEESLNNEDEDTKEDKYGRQDKKTRGKKLNSGELPADRKVVKQKDDEDFNGDYRSKGKEDLKRPKQYERYDKFDGAQSKIRPAGNQGLKANYERRQNKLPPRLAKQREQNRLAQKGRDSWNPDGNGNDGQWRGDMDMTDMLEQINDFTEKKKEESAATKQKQQLEATESHDPNTPVQTIIFENTNFKGRQQQQVTDPSVIESKNYRNDFKGDGSNPSGNGSLQFPVTGFFKPEDNADLKLDFNFESEMTGVEEKMDKSLSSGHPSTEDLNLKIASVKKVWESLPSMAPISEGQPQSNLPTSRFQGGDDVQITDATSENMVGGVHDQSGNMFEKADGTAVNVAKVRPQQQQGQQQQQQQQQPQQHHPTSATSVSQTVSQSEYDRNLNRNNAVNYANRGGHVGSTLSALASPSILANQPPSLYQAFQLDGRNVTNPLYPPYGIGGQSVLLQSSGATPGDIFGAAAAASTNQFRLQAAAAQFAATSQQSTANPVLMSQPSLMTSALKQQSQIGAIGTKSGNGQFQQSGLGSLPGSGTSPMLIQYDTTGNPINYLPSSLQRNAAAAGQSGQTAFYQALAANSQAGGNRQQQQFNMQGFPANTQPGMQHLNASLQLRGGQGVSVPNVGMQQYKQDASVLKNLRSSESFSTHNVTSQSSTSANSGVNSSKEGYNPTPIQRPQGSMVDTTTDNNGSNDTLKNHMDDNK